MPSRLVAVLAGAVAVVAAVVLVVWMTTRTREPVRSAGEASEVDKTAGCSYYKVATDALNLFKEPSSGSDFLGQLKKNAIVCVARDQEKGTIVWTYVLYELEGKSRQTTIVGWITKNSLVPATAAELAALGGSPQGGASPAAPPAAQPTPAPQVESPPTTQPSASPPPAPPPAPEPRTAADDVVRFSEPIAFGPFPVNGNSLEHLIAGIPLFPPFEGLDEKTWKVTCSHCHKWDKQTLCTQAQVYVKDPNVTMRIPHPYGGPEKVAMMKWAKGGCQ
jgi:hypothetical protein